MWLHPACGKLLFVLADVAIGALLAATAAAAPASPRTAVAACALWLGNPVAVNVSTRGNADALVALVLLAALCLLLRGRLVPAALLYGASVHLKVYPVIYAPTLALFLARHDGWHPRVPLAALLTSAPPPPPPPLSQRTRWARVALRAGESGLLRRPHRLDVSPVRLSQR